MPSRLYIRNNLNKNIDTIDIEVLYYFLFIEYSYTSKKLFLIFHFTFIESNNVSFIVKNLIVLKKIAMIFTATKFYVYFKCIFVKKGVFLFEQFNTCNE